MHKTWCLASFVFLLQVGRQSLPCHHGAPVGHNELYPSWQSFKTGMLSELPETILKC